MKKIVIVGGGYAGFYAAWNLEKTLRPDEAEITVIDPRPYMTYQPFLPEVMAGSVEARHAAVSLRKHLRRTKVVAGEVTRVEHARRALQVRPADGDDVELDYDVIVITAGAVTRTFPIPGIAEQAIGMKHVEEAVAIRDTLLTSFDRASVLPPGPERQRLLTVTFVGGGFSGVEGFGELLSLATSLLRSYPELSLDGPELPPRRGRGPDPARGHRRARALGGARARGARRARAPEHAAGLRAWAGTWCSPRARSSTPS